MDQAAVSYPTDSPDGHIASTNQGASSAVRNSGQVCVCPAGVGVETRPHPPAPVLFFSCWTSSCSVLVRFTWHEVVRLRSYQVDRLKPRAAQGLVLARLSA